MKYLLIHLIRFFYQTTLSLLGKKTGAKLIQAYKKGQRDFRGWKLKGANLQGASLFNVCQGTDVTWIKLQWVSLFNFFLKGVDLQGADLQGADLRWADLSRANLEDANLKGAWYSFDSDSSVKTTWFPSGFNPKAQGMILKDSVRNL